MGLFDKLKKKPVSKPLIDEKKLEEVMELSSSYDEKTELPKDETYFECDLPPFLVVSIEAMKKAQAKLDHGKV